MSALVGILNLTPDSFSGSNLPADAAAMIAAGATVIDVGAESTRPGATPISPEEEWRRLEPFFNTWAGGAILSIDTRHPETAARALQHGAEWINDVSGFENPAMVAAVRASACKLVVMHSLSVPADKTITLPENVDVVAELIAWARARFAALEAAGIPRNRLIFDPGIGFGKTAAQSWQIIHRVEEFAALGVPVLIGHSRKSFLSLPFRGREGASAKDSVVYAPLPTSPLRGEAATLSVSRTLIQKNVAYLRVHDVAAHAQLQVEHLLAALKPPETIDLSLGRMERLLAALGNPHHHLPPVIHVAGTNGKGSLIAYLRAIYEAAGLRVHAYTSPHLVRFNERIVVASREITDAALARALARVQKHETTFFEATTAAAFLAFSETPADVLLLEVGLGGRLDATNVIAKPALTAITPIGMDHMEFLGDTIEKIAAEKAGIIKPGVPVVIGPQKPQAMEVILRVANERGAPAYAHGHDWQVDETLNPALAGAHQAANASTAAVCARLLCVGDDAISQGIRSARWPARLQQLPPPPQPSPASGRGGHVEMFLDGGHNVAAAEALAAWASGGPPLTLVVGMMRRKDVRAFLAPLAPHTQHVIGVPIPGEDCYSAEEIVAAARALGIAAETAESVEKALGAYYPLPLQGGGLGRGSDFVDGLLHPPPALPPCRGEEVVRILICGSLYLAGVVLSMPAYDPANQPIPH